MEEKNYSKHKECSPEKTVDRIKEILDNIGLEYDLNWSENEFDGAYSNRVTIKGTNLGTNGKGTTREYALASGFAEFMERIQNDCLNNREYFHGKDMHDEIGFYYFPDEKLASPEELFTDDNYVIRKWLEVFEVPENEGLEFLRNVADAVYGREDGKQPAVEFYDQFAGKKVLVPALLLKRFAGSNGMAAGNTLTEAFVQGLSEVFERIAQLRILQENLTPPVISDEYLRYAGMWELIRKVEETGRFKVDVYDCSLGEGYPVIGSLFRDLAKGSFCFKLGAHPSFAVAVERTLTEAFQGKKLERISGWHAIGSPEEVNTRNNIVEQLTKGKGLVPASLLAGTPDWEFKPWEDVENLSNEQMKDRMLDFAKSRGFDLLVRDTSFLGFPSCHILIPGVSEVNLFSLGRLSNFILNYRFIRIVNHFPDITEEEEDVMIECLEHNLRFERMSTARFMFIRPLDEGMMHPEKILAFLYLKKGRFAEAKELFLKFGSIIESDMAKLYWKAFAEYCGMRQSGIDEQQALQVINRLYPPMITNRFADDVKKENMLARSFIRMNCYNCDDCLMNKMNHCAGKTEKEALIKIKRAMNKCIIEQKGV